MRRQKPKMPMWFVANFTPHKSFPFTTLILRRRAASPPRKPFLPGLGDIGGSGMGGICGSVGVCGPAGAVLAFFFAALMMSLYVTGLWGNPEDLGSTAGMAWPGLATKLSLLPGADAFG